MVFKPRNIEGNSRAATWAVRNLQRLLRLCAGINKRGVLVVCEIVTVRSRDCVDIAQENEGKLLFVP